MAAVDIDRFGNINRLWSHELLKVKYVKTTDFLQTAAFLESVFSWKDKK
jgi:hypothetical protein